MSGVWPTELRFKRSDRVLAIQFDNGTIGDIPFELLRVESPSAEVQGHGGAQKTLVLDKGSVNVERAEPVGRYAVRIVFDDGHASGLYTWNYLRELAENKDRLLSAYRDRVRDVSAR